MVNEQIKNIAFIDGQNLYMGTAKREIDPWKINLAHFRVYLEKKYKNLVDFLIEENKFEKILFPDWKKASSLYKKLGTEFYDPLDSPDIKNKIGVKKEKGSLGS